MNTNIIYELTNQLCDILKSDYAKRGSNVREYSFVIEPGRKYFKIIQVSNQRCCHAFVDKKTGDVYKPAGWAQPAKGIRYNLKTDMKLLENRADWAGGYLYR